MDVQTFLESGLIEAYALNQCSADERATVESMLRQHPSLREELSRIELALEQFAQANAVTPPVGLRSKVLEEIARESVPVPNIEHKFTRHLILGAAISAAIVMGILWQGSVRGYRLLETKNQRLQKEMGDCQTRQKEYIAMEQQLNLLSDPATKVITIAGKDKQTTIIPNRHWRWIFPACQKQHPANIFSFGPL